MPIYEYECDKCKTVYECLVEFKNLNKNDIICSKCNTKCKKIMSQTYFHASIDSPQGISPIEPGSGITTRIPIIKDRKTGRVLSGPVLPGEK